MAGLYGLTLLPLERTDAVRAGELPLHQEDPFDRLMAAQAQLRKMAVATPDPAFTPYGVPTLWRKKAG